MAQVSSPAPLEGMPPDLAACPRDLIEQALAHADYTGAPRELTNELLEAACAGYFVDDTEAATA